MTDKRSMRSFSSTFTVCEDTLEQATPNGYCHWHQGDRCLHEVNLDQLVGLALTAPYRWVLIPQREDGGFTAMIEEFPGCVTEGDTLQEAWDCLQGAADGWIRACWKKDGKLPVPIEMLQEAVSGRLR